jgi:eukaryotic-like serine/threonine-protein kinase
MARLARLLPFLMPNEPATTDLDWTQLQGTTLEGGFQLESILSADEHRGVFKVRVLGNSAANAIANLFALEPAAAEEQVALWQQLRDLSDAHLSIPLGAGKATIDGATLGFVILTRPDEKLDAILAERALTPQETGECLTAIVAALEELHRHGFVHGFVAPEHILSIGEAIKLTTEYARASGTRPLLPQAAPRYKAPESAHENAASEADVWCIGATLIEILTQQPCREGLAQAEGLPAPLNSIARKCLEPDPAARPQLGQIEGLYRGSAASSAPKQQAAAAAAAAGAAYLPISASQTPTTSPEPHRAHLRPRAVAVKPVVEVRKQSTRPLWPYLAGIALLVLFVIWLWPRHRVQPPAPAPAAANPPHPPAAWESRTVPPAEAPKTNSSALPPAAVPSEKAGRATHGDVWRVVLYAYTREADAANKARVINAQHPELEATTFSPTGSSPYLVVAGGRLTHDDAARRLQRARSLGQPRDAYIQNYAQ